MKNENSTPHLPVNGTDYTVSCLLVCSPKEGISGEPSKCKGKVKRGLCLSTGPTSKAVLQAVTPFFSTQLSLQKMSHGTCRTKIFPAKIFPAKSPLMSQFPVWRESLPPSLKATGHPSLGGAASVHWGPCAHRPLHPWGTHTQLKSWVFGYDPGITSTKSMDFPQIYFSIMS